MSPPCAQLLVSVLTVVVGATVVVVVVGAIVVVGAAVMTGIASFIFLPSAAFFVRIAAVLSLLEFSLDPPQAASAIAAAVSSANDLDRVLNFLMPRWYHSCKRRIYHPQLFISYSLLTGLKNPRHECINCPQDLCLELDQ